jgi:hypothetical protein
VPPSAFALAAIAIHANELVEAGLIPSDLARPGKELYRKLNTVLKPVGHLDPYGPSFVRVQGSRQMIVVNWRKRGVWVQTTPILAYDAGGKVRAQYLPTVQEGLGWTAVGFRVNQDRLFGIGHAAPGNWLMPVAMVFVKSDLAWKPIAAKTTRSEISSIGFAHVRGSEIIAGFRSYEFKTLTAPHAGPLLTFRSTLRFEKNRFVSGPYVLEKNALAAFDDLVGAVYNNKPATVRKYIPDPTMRAYFAKHLNALGGSRAVVCVDNYVDEAGNVFGIEDSSRRGDWRGSLFVEFEKRGSDWHVVKVGREYNFKSARPK